MAAYLRVSTMLSSRGGQSCAACSVARSAQGTDVQLVSYLQLLVTLACTGAAAMAQLRASLVCGTLWWCLPSLQLQPGAAVRLDMLSGQGRQHALSGCPMGAALQVCVDGGARHCHC